MRKQLRDNKLELRREPKRRKRTRRYKVGSVSIAQSEILGETPPNHHHHISHSRNFPVPLTEWTEDDNSDIATKVRFHNCGSSCDHQANYPQCQDFVTKLQDHLLHRLRSPGVPSNGENFSFYDRQQIIFQSHRIFEHKVFRVNYTSYDIRRCQDSMNPRTQANVMVPAFDLSPETGESASGHPFLYARIIGVFHAEIFHSTIGHRPIPHTFEFLWVRWYPLNGT